MDLSIRQLTWFISFALCCGIIRTEDSYPSASELFAKEFPLNNGISEDKPTSQFPSLNNLKGVQIQNGYSGILIPERTIDKAESYLEAFGVDKGILEYVKALIPKTAKALFKFIVKVGAITVTAVLVLLISSSVAAAFCSYSELCSLKFNGLGWQNERLEESVRSFLTPDKVSTLSGFIHSAIRKYENLNRKKTKFNE